MAEIRCPMCGKPNPPEIEECQFCGARIKPSLASTPANVGSIKPGENPTKRDTSEFEKIKPVDEGSIHPGDAPTKKNTAELEQALPSWLRSLREGKSPAAGESSGVPSSETNPPASADAIPGSDSTGGLPDWLAGLGNSAADDDEEVPDWLATLGDKKPGSFDEVPEEKAESPSDLGSPDWLSRLGGEPESAHPEPPAAKNAPAFEVPAASSETPDWLQSIPAADASTPPASAPTFSEPAEPQGGGNIPEWLSGLPAISPEIAPAANTPTPTIPTEDTPDWMDNLKNNASEPEAVTPGSGDESIPDWLASFGSAPGTPASATGENVPDWLSNLESKSGAGSSTPLLKSDDQPAEASQGDRPDWLSQFKADVNTAEEAEKHKDDFEVVSEPSAPAKKTGPLPDWLSGIERTAPAAGDAPALIGKDKDEPPEETGGTAFSMETPDWLSKLKPDQIADRGREEIASSEPDNLEAADLPSWVQAMRPVEAVVSEATTTPQEDNQVTEQSGPLAGLHGVLPAGPGLGPMRKPPAYSVKLQVSDGQQRYAAFLERLVANEAQSRPSGTSRLVSSRIWRWLITVLLILAIGFPLISGLQVAPSTLLSSSDNGATMQQIEQLPANVPVLAVFDYEPALSGELEAIAAPIFDQLLSKGTPLALISTSPTGPILAERFLAGTPLVDIYKYKSDQQYVDLGYLAGGPTGISSFAMSPLDTVKYDVKGEAAWSKAPLQGVQRLSDFAAVIILTDNADTGRNWIEQAGQYLSKTQTVKIPMLMIISAQAEPMVQPYFDSGQLKGIVSGVADAKIYEQHYTRPGRANQYWGSLSTGVLVAEILIAIGAVWSTLAGLRARQNKSGEEA